MTLLLSIIAFVIIFSLLILIHEFGHFFAAKKSGIKVEEFGLGMPPKLWGYKPKNSETEYTLNAIPFGGFVRMYGEDSHDAKALKSDRSFAAKPAWQKIIVVVAGVVMNFILAFFLLTVGFTIGMQPLFVSSDDVFQGIDQGVIKIEPGLIVKQPLSKEIDLETGDKIVSVNGKKIIFGDEVTSLKDNEPVIFEVERKGQIVNLKGVNKIKEPFFKVYDPISIPRLVIKDLEPSSRLYLVGIRPGDVINKINDQQVFDFEQMETQLAGGQELKLEIDRLGKIEQILLPAADQAHLVISAVINNSPAQKADLRLGDEVLAVDNQKIYSLADIAKVMKAGKSNKKIVYQIRRDTSVLEMNLEKDASGTVGVLLSELISWKSLGMSYYIKSVPYAVIEIKDVSYPWYQAPVKAIQEMKRLSVLTVEMFGNVVAQVVTKFSVPEGVAGPVGIAQMTYVFVQEGFMSLLRFMALLSLSLGIINILPFPGLDGGRFFLIFVSVLIGKKINEKVEGYIHLVGFLLLMLLILVITFNDIVRIFVG